MAVELATPAETAAVAVPYSVRLAARRHAVSQDRRAYVRRAARELAWLRTARLKHGPGVALVDLSEGGALLDAEMPLKPGAKLVLELVGEGGELQVPLAVLRAHVSRLDGDVLVYRGACAFNARVDLRVLLAAAATRRDEFGGVDAALTHLLERLVAANMRRDTADQGILDAGRIVHVLASLHTRVLASGADDYARAVSSLLASVLADLRRDAPAADIAGLIRARVNGPVAGGRGDALPSVESAGDTQRRIARTADLLTELIAQLPRAGKSEPPPASEPDAPADPIAPGPASPASVTGAASTWQKIVVRYRDGKLLKGFSQDFHTSRGHFSLWPSLTAVRSERVIVAFSRLKAVFFVRDFNGNPSYIERDIDASGAGRRVEVTFVDNEVVRGTTLSYRPDGYGFFMNPSDPQTNNQRIFVVSAALRHVRFP